MLAALPILLVTTLALDPSPRSRAPISAERIEEMLTSPQRHVRGVGAIADVLAFGARRSYTFAHLLNRLEDSDLIVYAEFVPDMPLTLAGRMLFVGTAHGQRYVRVQIAPSGAGEDMAAILAHELQHALEIADAPHVRDDDGVAALYRKIGVSGDSRDHYDTQAARLIGRTVRSELAG